MRKTNRIACLAVALALTAPAVSAQTTGKPATTKPAKKKPASKKGAAAKPPAPPSLADSLTGPAHDEYEAGRAAASHGDFAGAAAQFEHAYELARDPRLLWNIHVCYKKLHQYVREKAVLDQYKAVATNLNPEDQTELANALTTVNALVGAVRVSVTPDGTSVLVDGTAAGVTPITAPIWLDVGPHTFSLRKEGYITQDKPVDVPSGGTADLAVALAEEHLANVTITSDPAATISFDGTVVGAGRYQARVASGLHTIHVTEDGKIPYDSQVTLHDNDNQTMEVTLKEHKAPVWPWIVGGAVVVVAAAAVGGYFLFEPSNTTEPVPNGKLGPGGVTLSSLRGAR